MKPEQKRLLQRFDRLSAEQQNTILAFVEFLASRNLALEPEVARQTPQPIPRPTSESVIQAVKRLRATYPMLDSSALLHEISSFVMKHAVYGKPAAEVIDELEAFFTGQYAAHKDAR